MGQYVEHIHVYYLINCVTSPFLCCVFVRAFVAMQPSKYFHDKTNDGNIIIMPQDYDETLPI